MTAQALAATIIYGVIAFFLLACANVAAWGALQPQAAPALVFIAGFFGILGGLAAMATVFCAKSK